MKLAFRSLARTRGLALLVVLTLALGIGANTAIFSVVRGVLLRPLVNRDEGRLIYIRRSAPGLGIENTTFSMPEIRDLRSRVLLVGRHNGEQVGHTDYVAEAHALPVFRMASDPWERGKPGA